MKKICAFVDGVANSSAVIHAAAWSAQRLEAPLELTHVLAPRAQAVLADYSGSIGLGAQESLLDELSQLDERRHQQAQEAGRALLAEAQRQARDHGALLTEVRLRHGDVVDAALELEPETRLFVFGEHHHVRPGSKVHLDHHVERVLRSVKVPTLVVTHDHFVAPRRFGIAFDGSATSRAAVERVAGSPLLAGLEACVWLAGDDTPAAREQLAWARGTLGGAGFGVEAAIAAGEPHVVLPQVTSRHGIDLLVMGAHGHSRLRQLVLGSTTATLLRSSPVPVLVLR